MLPERVRTASGSSKNPCLAERDALAFERAGVSLNGLYPPAPPKKLDSFWNGVFLFVSALLQLGKAHSIYEQKERGLCMTTGTTECATGMMRGEDSL